MQFYTRFATAILAAALGPFLFISSAEAAKKGSKSPRDKAIDACKHDLDIAYKLCNAHTTQILRDRCIDQATSTYADCLGRIKIVAGDQTPTRGDGQRQPQGSVTGGAQTGGSQSGYQPTAQTKNAAKTASKSSKKTTPAKKTPASTSNSTPKTQ